MAKIHRHIAREKGRLFRGKPNAKAAERWLTENSVTPHHDPITGKVILVKNGKAVPPGPHAIPHTGDAHKMRNQ